MVCSEILYLALSEIDLLPENPRTITKADFQRLVDSIKINGFWKHRPLALVRRGERLVVLAGNQRLKAARKLKLQSVPCVIYSETTKDEELDIIARDNINNGEWDYGILQTSEEWAAVDFDFMGLTIPEEKEDKPKKRKKQEEPEDEDPEDNQEAEEDSESEDEEDNEKEAFYRSMFKDVLYESDNIFEIPNLLL